MPQLSVETQHNESAGSAVVQDPIARDAEAGAAEQEDSDQDDDDPAQMLETWLGQLGSLQKVRFLFLAQGRK